MLHQTIAGFTLTIRQILYDNTRWQIPSIDNTNVSSREGKKVSSCRACSHSKAIDVRWMGIFRQ